MDRRDIPHGGVKGPQKTLGFAIGALILSVLMNLYHFSLEGTGGLYTWHPILALKLLVVMGLGPLVVAVLYLVIKNRGPLWLASLFRWLSLISSVLVSLASLALLAFLILVPRSGTLRVPPLSLIDPGKGLIIPNRAPSPAPSGGTPWYDHYQNIKALVPLFEKYRVNLVISGHNHYQELLSHNGVTYAIIGSMGGLPDPKPTHLSPASLWLAVGKFGWLDVDILSDRMILTFRSETGAERYRAPVEWN